MKLLFDQNLSPSLVSALRDLCPGSVHVRDVGLQDASDETVWKYAAQEPSGVGSCLDLAIQHLGICGGE